jgi:hypothetical protein
MSATSGSAWRGALGAIALGLALLPGTAMARPFVAVQVPPPVVVVHQPVTRVYTVAAPTPDYVWVGPHWETVGYNTVWVEGYWQYVAPPPPRVVMVQRRTPVGWVHHYGHSRGPSRGHGHRR